jgi:hypothetical protein
MAQEENPRSGDNLSELAENSGTVCPVLILVLARRGLAMSYLRPRPIW